MITQKSLLTISLFILTLFVISLNLVSALSLSVDQQNLYPGESAAVSIDVENTLNDDINDVSLSLDLSNSQFSSTSGTEDTQNTIDSDDKETFDFNLKASQSIKPGDYNIPYTLTYTIDDENETQKTEKGTLGITVGAKTQLEFVAETQNNIVDRTGKVSLKIVNKGLGDIRFVNVKIIPQGFTLLGSDSNYIGTVSSDDFETATYDVVFKNTNAKLVAEVTYRDFDNNEITENINLPVKVYTKDEALSLGIIKPNNIMYYVVAIVVLVILFFVYRIIRKSMRNNKRKESA